MQDRPVEEDKKFENVETGARIHPYLSYRHTIQSDTEVIHRVTDSDDSIIRNVFVRNGSYEVWVKVGSLNEHGYELQPEERVSEAEFEAICLKHKAMKANPKISLDYAYSALTEAVENEEEDAINHLLIATYHAAKTDPEVDENTIGDLRDFVHEQTGHVDTSDPETVRGALDDAIE
jgi:hypothetical protein